MKGLLVAMALGGAALVALLGVARVHDLDAESPQLVQIPLGATKMIGAGRATAWFGEVDLGPVIEVKCKEGAKRLELADDAPSEECCGVRLRLVEWMEDPSPKAKIEVTWIE